ncbi:pre-mRNA-splicing factor ISY1 homolog [Arctopsyche grandis]|uniref:pre-mRNA-splicing factor ISY1 homolog n=1 Tax=Arctopsyche grandis TaxID=121162 RepID=UPI00406D8B07
MARNAEKAMTTLARWRAAQVQEAGGLNKERRPFLASECGDLPQAEKWRLQIIGEIAKKVAQIQNAGLGEFRIRDLNDEINKLLREKRHWEDQIRELGGPDYFRVGPRMLDHEGREVPGNRGYRYFGAAKDLPGVRELFDQAPPLPPRKTRTELMRDIDADYYGYRDDDDGLLLPLEKEAEKIARSKAIEEWKAKKESGVTDEESAETDAEDIYNTVIDDTGGAEDPTASSMSQQSQYTSHVPVPSQKDVEEALLRKKKQELLDKYGCMDVKLES